MTDEQICKLAKDKALDIQKYIIDGNVDIDSFAKDCCLAGAHNRDEEIRQLNDVISDYSETIDQLRNPWISVEERLPEEDPDDKGYSVEVIGLFPNGSISNCFCSIEENIWFIDDLVCKKPTCWMPIPQIKKGGEK